MFHAFALAAAGNEIEYLCIDASEGTASGAHAALTLGDEVFHFQHVPPGLARVRRDDFKRSLNQYGDRENRSIRLHRVEVAAETTRSGPFEGRLAQMAGRIEAMEGSGFLARMSPTNGLLFA